MPNRRRIVDAVIKLSMTDENAMLGLLRRGWSDRRISREAGYHRATVRRIRQQAEDLASKCTTPAEVPTDRKPATAPEVATDTASRSSAEPFRAFIAAETDKGRNAKAIYEQLVEHHGYSGSYDAIKRLARKLRDNDRNKISCRFETDPGKKRRSITAKARSREIRVLASFAGQACSS